MVKRLNKKISRIFDKLFESITLFLGSTPVILASMIWCAHAYVDGNRTFLDIISMVTFIFGELILRGQNVQNNRIENKLDK